MKVKGNKFQEYERLCLSTSVHSDYVYNVNTTISIDKDLSCNILNLSSERNELENIQVYLR